MTFNKIQLKLIESSDSPELMKEAIKEGEYYVVATPCNSGYAIGSFDDEIPALMATKEEATKENQDMVEAYLEQIKNNDRDKEDEWEGEVLLAKWDCVTENIDLFSDGRHIHTESWKGLSGL